MAAYIFIARPYQLGWGATRVEIDRSMPGDERRGNPTFLATRAITIEDTPENIWPWLIQMGYGRAGFYGYDIIENLGSENGIYSADRIQPDEPRRQRTGGSEGRKPSVPVRSGQRDGWRHGPVLRRR